MGPGAGAGAAGAGAGAGAARRRKRNKEKVLVLSTRGITPRCANERPPGAALPRPPARAGRVRGATMTRTSPFIHACQLSRTPAGFPAGPALT